MLTNRTYLHFFRQFFDYACIIFIFLLDSIISTGREEILYTHKVNEILLLLLLLFTWFISTHSTNLYDEFRSRNFSFELVVLIKNILVQILVSIVLIFLIKEITFSRLFVLYNGLFLFLFLITEKFLFSKVLDSLRKRGRNIRSILIIGAGDVGKKFFYTIKDNPHFGYKVVGFLDDFEIPMHESKYLGQVSKLSEVLEKYNIDNVIVALPNYATEKLLEVIHTCEVSGKNVRIIPDYFRFASSKYNITMFGKFPVIAIKSEKIDQFHWRFWKRLFDIAFSLGIFIFILSWLYPLIALLIKLDSKGPAVFKQERWGRDKKIFTVFKFRSMICTSKDYDKNGKFLQAKPNDPRMTRLGRFLRSSNIDELPQFLNVLKGEMSVVGPRPHAIRHNLETKDLIPHYMLRHQVKPGITGWAQVNGYRGETSDITLMEKRVEYDLWYIENWSLLLDIQIIFLTIWLLIKGDKNAY
ncbi:MAG: undecaprenyl-phosphate glucose phosphotransferase [Elusimicrobiota bacterium]